MSGSADDRDDAARGSDRPVAATAPLDPYRELFERSADAILIIEGDTFIDCNEATVRMLRYQNKADLLRTHPSELSPPRQPDGRDSFEKANEYMAIAFARGSHRFEWDHLRADGEIFPVEVLLTAVQQQGRRVLHVVWRDITDRKRLELELRHAQKMEAIGKLAGGIAHDFNNLLVAIVGNGDLLSSTLAGNEEAQTYLGEIQAAADRAAGLVRQLLAFSRKQEVQPRVIDINELIEGIRTLLERVIGEDVQLLTGLCEDSPRVLADRGQLEQVLLNLASNSRDAMPDGGVLAIETRILHEGELLIGDVDRETSKPLVLISVSDNGSGMTIGTRERAFDPFFTTKPVGQGTGLGLATAYGIVHQAGGSIGIDSAVGHGTLVRIVLPAARDEVKPAPRQGRATAVRGGDESILLVEDDSAVSSMVANSLRRHGFQVSLARNGEVALDTFLADPDGFDLIVSDVIMPELGGPELIARLKQAGHTPRVLFMSGYTNNALSRLHRIQGDVDLLEKPFRARDLIDRVRQVLDRPR